MKRVLFTLFILLMTTSVEARYLSHQGLLSDRGGKALNGTVEMTFRLYDDAEESMKLWEEKQTVSLEEGLYTVALGKTNPIDDDLLMAYENLYLGVTIGTDSEMTPRLQIFSVPSAMVADRARIADRLVGDAILPSLIIGGAGKVIDEQGRWVGPPIGGAGGAGPQGPKGDKGDKGDAGAAGPAGPQGPQGLQGAAGLQGATGAQGAAGVVPAGQFGSVAISDSSTTVVNTGALSGRGNFVQINNTNVKSNSVILLTYVDGDTNLSGKGEVQTSVTSMTAGSHFQIRVKVKGNDDNNTLDTDGSDKINYIIVNP